MKIPKQYSELKDKRPALYDQFKNHPDKRALFNTFSEDELIFLVKHFPLQLEFIDNQTERVVKWALKKNSSALEFVKNQTEEHCLIAIDKKMNGCNGLDYVKNLTDKIKLIAVQRSRSSLSQFPLTEDLWLVAMEYHELSIKFIQDQTPKIKRFVLEKNPRELEHINNQTIEDCFRALSSTKKDDYENMTPIYKMVKIVPNPDYGTTIKNLKLKQSMLSIMSELK